MDESFPDKERFKSSSSNEHRFILFTFNELEKLQLRHTWKDSYSNLQEELKNISFENRNNFKTKRECNEPEFLKVVAEQFEEFMKKFEASYFNCTNMMGGHFILKESENVFMFSLSSQKWKLESLSKHLKLGWQRKNVYIQLHPESYKDFCENSNEKKDYNFNYFPVTNLRDSDQLARTLCHANIYNSFETQNMEFLGKGGLVDFIINNFGGLGLIRPEFLGKPKWPVPNTLTDESWSNLKPTLILNPLNESEIEEMPKIIFDEYSAYSPNIFEALKQNNYKYFSISIQCQLGIIPIGYGESIEAQHDVNNAQRILPLMKIFIGPFNIFQFNRIIKGQELFSKYLQNIPQFYEYFLHCNLGESRWNELFRLCGGISRKNEFPLPSGLVESKNYFKTFWRLKSKNDLALLVERVENSHKLRTSKRQGTYHPCIFPSLEHLQKDSGNLNRLNARFKNSLKVFLASSDAKLGCSSAFGQFQLPQVIFKHSLSVHQMTDFSETMQKKRSLRPLFNEHERDLFEILKEMPILSEEMASAQFVSGDIFGNPYKKEKKTREPSLLASKRAASNITNSAFALPSILDESGDEAEHENFDLSELSEISESSAMMSPMSIDEIDYKEMEDVETEIVLNGSIVNIPISNIIPASQVDLKIVEKWIKSPGGLEAKTKLIETLPIISNLDDLEVLLDLSKRFKRITLTSLITERINKIKT